MQSEGVAVLPPIITASQPVPVSVPSSSEVDDVVAGLLTQPIVVAVDAPVVPTRKQRCTIKAQKRVHMTPTADRIVAARRLCDHFCQHRHWAIAAARAASDSASVVNRQSV